MKHHTGLCQAKPWALLPNCHVWTKQRTQHAVAVLVLIHECCKSLVMPLKC